MTEEQLWRWMRPRLPPGCYDRIESPITPGYLDVSYAIRGGHGWIELKATTQRSGYPFKRERCGLRASQKLWIAERRSFGLGKHILIVAAMAQDVAVWSSSIAPVFNDLHHDELHARARLWVARRKCRLLPVELLQN